MFGSGGPCDVSITHVGGHVYTIGYSVTQTGVYTLHVKWGDHAIPGSPFRVTAH